MLIGNVEGTFARSFRHNRPPTPQVSRSFAAVIQQLPKVLAKDVMVFYLVLRGLDTVEDDMTAFKDIQVSCFKRLVLE